MIRSFACRETQALFNREWIATIPFDIQRSALRKLKILDSAVTLKDLLIPPANRLEKLKGKRLGQYSIRINSQWRICFYYENGHAEKVEIVDYH